MIPSVAAADRRTEAPAGRAGPAGLPIRLAAMLGRPGGRLVVSPDRRIGLANPHRGSFVTHGIDRTAKLTRNPLGGAGAIVAAHERLFSSAPRTATAMTAGRLRATGTITPVVTAGTATILTSSHCELLV